MYCEKKSILKMLEGKGRMDLVELASLFIPLLGFDEKSPMEKAYPSEVYNSAKNPHKEA